MRLPLSLDETLLGQALALQACLAVGSRLHPFRQNKVSHLGKQLKTREKQIRSVVF